MSSLLLCNPANEAYEFNKLVLTIEYLRDTNKMTLNAKIKLLELIRPEFFKKLLTNINNDDMSEYKKFIASKVLVEFCNDAKMAKHPNIVMYAAEMLTIVCNNGEKSYSKHSLRTLNNAYLYLDAISQSCRGQLALCKLMAIRKLCQLYLITYKYQDSILQIFSKLIIEQHHSWRNEDPMLFHQVMNKMALNFRHECQLTKFISCERLRRFLYLCPLEICTLNWKNQTWPQDIYQEVKTMLSGPKEGYHWDGAITLAPTVLNMLGLEWIPANPEEFKKFFILLVQSMLTELPLKIQKKTLATVTINANVILDCLTTLELLLLYTNVSQLELNMMERMVINKLLACVFKTLTRFLKTVFKPSKITRSTSYLKHRYILMMVRFLGTWICHNKIFINPNVEKTLPVILETANKSFYAHRAFNNLTTISETSENSKWVENYDVLRQILFLIGILASDESYKKLLLQQNQDQVLLDCLEYYWASFYQQILSSDENTNSNIINYSRKAVIELVIIFHSIIEDDLDYIEKSPLNVKLREFLLNNYSKLPNSQDNLAVSGHLAVLSIRLLLMDNLAGDPRALEFLDVVIHFLHDVCEMSVFREDISNLWLSCMHIIPHYISIVLPFVNLATNLEYIRKIVDILLKVTNNNIRFLLKPVYEGLFCQIFQHCPIFSCKLKNCGLLDVCKNYNMTELVKLINPTHEIV